MTFLRAWLRLAVFVALLLAAMPALAAPAQIIILRHGEKQNPFRLCPTGLARAQALAGRYLGRGAQDTLFPGGAPAAIFAITLHSLELAAPAATSWGLPVTTYPVLPGETSGFTDALAARTREAVRALMDDLRWAGKTVAMVWEHHHIANAKLEAANPGRQVTLRQLLRLDTLPGVPATWPTETFDYFWIVDFAPDGTPTRFTLKKQVFDGAFAKVPSNDWGEPDGLGKASGCLR
ncbi:histidine phosphatase family protein [Aquabacter sp. CN5-332]|uniref:histidine phosphatase family protein n=1 Tax=Aquabacter sp. CN5-332 TaxID=3156608 RepID=UPI0032B31D5A